MLNERKRTGEFITIVEDFEVIRFSPTAPRSNFPLIPRSSSPFTSGIVHPSHFNSPFPIHSLFQTGQLLLKLTHLEQASEKESPQKPKDLLEYVIVHEMAHLIAPRHSDHFVAILQNNYPAWREARAEVNELPLSVRP